MISSLVILAALASPGQPAATSRTIPPFNAVVATQSKQGPSLHVRADDSGKEWSSPDPVWLAKWVGIVNERLAIYAKPGSRPLPTGVIASRLPHIKPGQVWHGGNVGNLGIERGGTIGATEPAGPDVFLTVIGPDEQRKAVVDELARNPDLAAIVTAMGERLAVHDYAPDEPMVADVGLPDGGRPDIVIQDSTGTVQYRAHDNPGPTVLAEELRKADPKYKPADDPAGGWSLKDLNLDKFFGNAEDQAPVLIALGLLGFVWYWNRT